MYLEAIKRAIPINLIMALFHISFSLAQPAQSQPPEEKTNPSHKSISALPFVMYDSDIGFGFGGKAVLKDRTNFRSYDIIIFGSTKGEQWYAFAFSWPDAEIRQGTRYKLGFDTKVEFDKLVKSNYFGPGNNSIDNEYQFPRESFKINQIISHAFSTRIIGSATMRMAHYSAYDFNSEWGTINPRTPGAGESQLFAIGGAIKYDSRDSNINPKEGMRLEGSVERSLKAAGSDWGFSKSRLEFSTYGRIFGQDDVLAFRLWLQNIAGTAPYQELSKFGDGWTGRGYKADRFLDNAISLSSLEYRFPLYKKLGGVAFVDAGRVWARLSDISFRGWHSDWGGGLRYYMANFVARLDIGHSVEGTRIFFNFGQVF